MTFAPLSQLSAVGFAVRSAERGGTPRRETPARRRAEAVSRARRQAQSEGGTAGGSNFGAVVGVAACRHSGGVNIPQGDTVSPHHRNGKLSRQREYP